MPRSRKKRLTWLGWNDDEIRAKLGIKKESKTKTKKAKAKKIEKVEIIIPVPDEVKEEPKDEKEGFWKGL